MMVSQTWFVVSWRGKSILGSPFSIEWTFNFILNPPLFSTDPRTSTVISQSFTFSVMRAMDRIVRKAPTSQCFRQMSRFLRWAFEKWSHAFCLVEALKTATICSTSVNREVKQDKQFMLWSFQRKQNKDTCEPYGSCQDTSPIATQSCVFSTYMYNSCNCVRQAWNTFIYIHLNTSHYKSAKQWLATEGSLIN